MSELVTHWLELVYSYGGDWFFYNARPIIYNNARMGRVIMNMTLKTLLELQKEIELYCDPSEKVSAMIDRFIEIELGKLN